MVEHTTVNKDVLTVYVLGVEHKVYELRSLFRFSHAPFDRAGAGKAGYDTRHELFNSLGHRSPDQARTDADYTRTFFTHAVNIGHGIPAGKALGNTVRLGRDGRINEIDRCCGCNEGCLDGFANLDMPHITCLRNPAVGREAECVITPSDNPRTVLVAGGGMAGMMAARTLRKRGHRVILCEASNRLGGQFILAGSTPHKLDMKKAALEMGEQIVNLGIDVRLNTPVTAELIRQLKSDAVFNCIGSSPIIPSIPGSSLPNVVESHDIIDGKVKVSGKVVIIGGGMVGLETAELLIESGLTPPTVLEMGSAVCVDMGSARKYCMMQTIEDSKIACVTDIKVTEIRENMVIGEKNGEHLEFPCDYAVFAVGSHSRDSHELKEACSELGIDLITVGDAKEARRALEATREAFDAALAF